MKDVHRRAEEDMGIIEKIASIIPGFAGYMRRERRRDSDKIQREFIAKALAGNKSFLDDVIREAASEGLLEILDDLDRLKKKIDKTSERIRHADYGYSGFFDAVKIREDELAQLHRFDLEMISAVKETEDRLKTLPAGAGDVEAMKASAKACARILDDLDRKFSDREAMIMGVK
ncbi:MAG: hypothetical protein ACYTHM_20730 [Planctomycetota bacterium]|jgi:hypothetical protein